MILAWTLGFVAVAAIIATGSILALAQWPEQWTLREHCRRCRAFGSSDEAVPARDPLQKAA